MYDVNGVSVSTGHIPRTKDMLKSSSPLRHRLHKREYVQSKHPESDYQRGALKPYMVTR